MKKENLKIKISKILKNPKNHSLKIIGKNTVEANNKNNEKMTLVKDKNKIKINLIIKRKKEKKMITLMEEM